jgi:protein-disulfide isomerase
MAKLAKDIKSEAVQKRIDEDMAEAAKFGFQGTPGFLLNDEAKRKTDQKTDKLDLNRKDLW